MGLFSTGSSVESFAGTWSVLQAHDAAALDSYKCPGQAPKGMLEADQAANAGADQLRLALRAQVWAPSWHGGERGSLGDGVGWPGSGRRADGGSCRWARPLCALRAGRAACSG